MDEHSTDTGGGESNKEPDDTNQDASKSQVKERIFNFLPIRLFSFVKMFYFFFYAGHGSLIAATIVILRQHGMTRKQIGIAFGSRHMLRYVCEVYCKPLYLFIFVTILFSRREGHVSWQSLTSVMLMYFAL